MGNQKKQSGVKSSGCVVWTLRNHAFLRGSLFYAFSRMQARLFSTRVTCRWPDGTANTRLVNGTRTSRRVSCKIRKKSFHSARPMFPGHEPKHPLTPSLPMNLAPTHPALTPPRRGTGQPVLLPSWEGLGVSSGAQCAVQKPWKLFFTFGASTAILAARCRTVFYLF